MTEKTHTSSGDFDCWWSWLTDLTKLLLMSISAYSPLSVALVSLLSFIGQLGYAFICFSEWSILIINRLFGGLAGGCGRNDEDNLVLTLLIPLVFFFSYLWFLPFNEISHPRVELSRSIKSTPTNQVCLLCTAVNAVLWLQLKGVKQGKWMKTVKDEV